MKSDMHYDQPFPLHMSTDDDEAGVWIHRDIPGKHVACPHCWCSPVRFTQDEMEGSPEELNARLEALNRRN